MNKTKLLLKATNCPQNLSFNEFVALIEAYGFTLERANGSHRIYRHPQVRQKLVIQDDDGKAKAYQVRQLLKLVEGQNLTLD